mgnify:CR=1 FL=1
MTTFFRQRGESLAKHSNFEDLCLSEFKYFLNVCPPDN